MSDDKMIYRFEDFELDPSESSLRRSGEPVSITPKALHLLRLLVQNHGHVLDKTYLLDQVWAGSFVEEGNLTFNIRQLRKILGDDAKNPRFIETVPKRGYRFIAKLATENEQLRTLRPDEPSPTLDTRARSEPKRWARWVLRPLASVILFVVAAATVGTYYAPLLIETDKSGILTEPFSVEMLSSDGSVPDAVLSDGGDFVVYVAGNGGESNGLWYRELATGRSREILSSTELPIIGVDLGADGQSVYFVRREETGGKDACLYRTNILGAVPQKLVCGIEGWFDVSADGQRLSYVRCPYTDGDYCSLYVADSNGTNERRLVTQPSPIRISDNAFSPSGTSIAYAAGQSRDGSNDRSVKLIDLVSQRITDVTDRKFGALNRIGWLPDGKTLLVTALTATKEKTHFWTIEIETGEATSINKDDRKYNVISVDSSGSKLLSTVVEPDFRIFSYQMKGTEKPKDLGRGIAPRFQPDGTIVTASDRAGRMGIWTFEKDGSNPKQITFGPVDDSPVMSVDGSRVYFSSIRQNRYEIWSVRRDGSDLRMIETEEGGFPIGISSDGSKLFFVSGMTRSLRTILTDGSNETELVKNPIKGPTVSPDALAIAHFDTLHGQEGVSITSVLTGGPIARFPLPEKNTIGRHLAWSYYSRTLYILTKQNQESELSVWKLDMNSGQFEFLRKLPTTDLGERSGFAVSPDELTFLTAQGRWKHDMVLITGLE